VPSGASHALGWTWFDLASNKLRRVVRRRQGAGWSAAIEQKHPVLLEYPKTSFERIKQRLRHFWALARVKRVLNDYTLASYLDREFGNLPDGLREILLSMIHG
jgi:hypothetical protein